MPYGYLTTRNVTNKLLDIGVIWQRMPVKHEIVSLSDGGEIYIFTLPFRDVHITQANILHVERAVKKALQEAKTLGVKSVTGCWMLRDSGILYSCADILGIHYPDGNKLFYALLPQAIRKALKENSVVAENASVAISAQTPALAEKILNSVHDIFKDVAIIGGDEFLTIAENICVRFGLAVRVCKTAYADVTIYACKNKAEKQGRGIIFDLYGCHSEGIKVVSGAEVKFKSNINLPMGNEIADLPLAEWYLNVQYNENTLEEAVEKSFCRINKLFYKTNF